MKIGKNFEIDLFELMIICGAVTTALMIIFGK